MAAPRGDRATIWLGHDVTGFRNGELLIARGTGHSGLPGRTLAMSHYHALSGLDYLSSARVRSVIPLGFRLALLSGPTALTLPATRFFAQVSPVALA